MKSKKINWPVLKNYKQNTLGHIAMPLGGIGTGTVSLGGRGDLRDWEIMNRPAKGFTPRLNYWSAWPFFAIYTKKSDGSKNSKLLEGPLEKYEYEGPLGISTPNHGLPRFREASFDAAYPLGQVYLRDRNMPVRVHLKAFNPLVPGDIETSGLPLAILKYQVVNTSLENVNFSICGSVPNFIGCDGSNVICGQNERHFLNGCKDNYNEFKKSKSCCGILLKSDGVDSGSTRWGTIALATPENKGISHRLKWNHSRWGGDILDFWDDFSDDGILEKIEDKNCHNPVASLCVSGILKPGESKEIVFLLGWHFPNRYSWTAQGQEPGTECESKNWNEKEFVGNYYATRFVDAWDAVSYACDKLKSLEQRTVQFVADLCGSDMPVEVLEAALFNLSTLRSQTCFMSAEGKFYGWEGCCDHSGCCWGTPTHVWNYDQSSAFVLGPLAKDMRYSEFHYATDNIGLMSFRIGLPVEKSKIYGKAAADGQMGCIMKIYRDWKHSGDNTMLETLWPNIRKAMEFAWIEGGWDANCDGVMEGCQHNTMDVEYFGPNPQMQFWYLGALKACEKMALHLGITDFAQKCESLFSYGSKWTDDNLFNGYYYEHQIIPPLDNKNVSSYLIVGMGGMNLSEADYQLGAGCLVDQLAGQMMAHICGLGYLARPANIRKTLESIMKFNYRDNFWDHFNNMRSYVAGNESGLVMASYPFGNRQKVPFPYFNEVMTGFEYTAAIGMFFENQVSSAIKCIRSIRNRYDGSKRSPFNEAECGHHYARALAAWGAIIAISGFDYSAVTNSLKFNLPQKKIKWFWSNGYSSGNVVIEPLPKKATVLLTVTEGEISLKKFTLNGFGDFDLGTLKTITNGNHLLLEIKRLHH